MYHTKRVYLFLLITALVLAGCKASVTPTSKTAPLAVPDKADQGSVPVDTVSSDKIKTIFMIAEQGKFDPVTIVVNKGDTVNLSIQSIDVDHGIAIPEFGVNKEIKAGETVEVESMADKSGIFPFFCNVYCGSGHEDMKGTLIVK